MKIKMDNDELMHYGVPGMKWGVRRTPAQLGRKKTSSSKSLFGKKKPKPKPKPKAKSESSKEETAPKKKSVKEMSNEELNAAIDRMRLEQTYASLSPQKVSMGKKIAKTILNDVVVPAATDVGRQMVKSTLARAGNKTLSEVFKDFSDEDKIYANNKKK